MAKVTLFLGGFNDWIGTDNGGIEFFRRSKGRRSRVLDLDAHAVRSALYDGSDVYVAVQTSSPSSLSRFVYSRPRGRRLASIWDYYCQVHGPSPASSHGQCVKCGRATFMRLLWRDPEAIAQIVGPVAVVGGKASFMGRVFEPGEVLEVYEDQEKRVFAKVLLFEPLDVQLPDDLELRRVDSPEFIWSPIRVMR